MNWTRLGRDADHPAGIARYMERGDTLYIWCGGTRNRREWRWNFQTRKLRAGSGKARVNRKDLLQAQDVFLALYKAGVKHCDRQVVIGGYSRGYAIALLLAWMIATYSEVTVLGFAGKRVGNKAFHDQLEEWGVAHCNSSGRWDVVPLLPPWYAAGKQHWMLFSINPVKAHVYSGHVAAYWRHEVTQ